MPGRSQLCPPLLAADILCCLHRRISILLRRCVALPVGTSLRSLVHLPLPLNTFGRSRAPIVSRAYTVEPSAPMSGQGAQQVGRNNAAAVTPLFIVFCVQSHVRTGPCLMLNILLRPHLCLTVFVMLAPGWRAAPAGASPPPRWRRRPGQWPPWRPAAAVRCRRRRRGRQPPAAAAPPQGAAGRTRGRRRRKRSGARRRRRRSRQRQRERAVHAEQQRQQRQPAARV